MSLEKETSAGEDWSWPLTSVWEEVAHMLDDYGLHVCAGCTDTAKKESTWLCRGLASTVRWLLPTNARLEADAQVRKQEEGLLLENDVWLSTTLPAVRLADKMGEQDKTLEILTCHLQRQKCST